MGLCSKTKSQVPTGEVVLIQNISDSKDPIAIKRGLVLKIILDKGEVSEKDLIISMKRKPERIRKVITLMVDEGFIKQEGPVFRIS